MYKIKEFAGLFGVSIATLHHYEKTGLLAPCAVNPVTGYRYYDTTQLTDMSLILQLKALGFSLREIREFQGKKLTYQNKLDILQERAARLQATIGLFELFQNPQPYRAYVKTMPEISVVSRRTQVAHYLQIRDVFESLLHLMAQNSLRLRQPGSYTCRFFDPQLQFENNDVEAAIEVLPSNHPSVAIQPRQSYLCALHHGEYQALGACYRFLEEYAARQGLRVIGHPVERYIESYGTKEREMEFITEVRFPIEAPAHVHHAME